jgi:hypothetical protein
MAPPINARSWLAQKVRQERPSPDQTLLKRYDRMPSFEPGAGVSYRRSEPQDPFRILEGVQPPTLGLNPTRNPLYGVGMGTFPARSLRSVWKILFAFASSWSSPNYNLPLDRPFSLRNPEPLLLELESHRKIESNRPRSYVYPRPCHSSLDSSSVCGDTGRLGYSDEANDRSLVFSPLLGNEYRYLDENVDAGEFGIRTWGNSGPLSFFLDARMITEFHENAAHPSYDREFVERQDEEDAHGTAYSSYSRYRMNFSYDMAWGRITVARDAAHWGPGLYGNLVFNQNGVPFNQAVFTTHLGPLTATSLYGRLSTSEAGEFDTDSVRRSVYAHRYEFTPSARWTFGISEQLIFFDREDPFAFIPIVPLYISKAYSSESHNNGNIAFDISYVIPRIASFYSEFLIDDLRSPAGLFDDRWSNKWAWLSGAHFVRDLRSGKTGMIIEICRVEPWVYTHYFPKTAQAANQGIPLGNPTGPNSLSIQGKAYAASDRFTVSLKPSWTWKGKDKGSSLVDTINEFSRSRKTFLAGASPRFSIDPGLAYTSKSGIYSVSLEATSFEAVWLALQCRY